LKIETNVVLIAFNWPFFMMIQASGFSWCIMGNRNPSIRFILQTTQHDDVLGGNVAIVHVGYQPPPP
jgi:hypothetical protein